jgi:hypothetical protein
MLAGLFIALAGCGTDDSGALRITTYGEDFIEQGIPDGAQSADGEGFADGFHVTFEKFLVVLGPIEVANRQENVGAIIADQQVFDMRLSGPHVVADVGDMGAQRWDEVSASIAPASLAIAGNATTADVARMNDEGYSVFVKGTADGPGGPYTFEWGFFTTTNYTSCEDADGQKGVVIPAGGRATLQFTVHGDHLFYDDLQSPDANLRFQAMADATTDDQAITLEELAAVDLTTLPSGQYSTGGAGNITNLRQFVEALTRTLVHYQGEGHCMAR